MSYRKVGEGRKGKGRSKSRAGRQKALSVIEQNQLLQRFVASFEKLGDMRDYGTDPASAASQLADGEPDEFGFRHWRPIAADTPQVALEEIYRRFPSRFPPLFERLVLSHRWAEVDLGTYLLLSNPPGPNLDSLCPQMTGDLGPVGFIQFGRAACGHFDPVCFDTKSRNGKKDCRIVRIDHEEVLCNYRVKVIEEIAPSFEELVMDTIRRAAL